MVKIERQIFVYYHVYLLRNAKFKGYVTNHFDTRKLTFYLEIPFAVQGVTMVEFFKKLEFILSVRTIYYQIDLAPSSFSIILRPVDAKTLFAN